MYPEEKFVNPQMHKNKTLLPQTRFLTHEGLAFCRDMYRVLQGKDQKKKEVLKEINFYKKQPLVLKSATLEQSNLDL